MKRRKGIRAQGRKGGYGYNFIPEMVLPFSRYAVEPLSPSILCENKGLR